MPLTRMIGPTVIPASQSQVATRAYGTLTTVPPDQPDEKVWARRKFFLLPDSITPWRYAVIVPIMAGVIAAGLTYAAVGNRIAAHCAAAGPCSAATPAYMWAWIGLLALVTASIILFVVIAMIDTEGDRLLHPILWAGGLLVWSGLLIVPLQGLNSLF